MAIAECWLASAERWLFVNILPVTNVGMPVPNVGDICRPMTFAACWFANADGWFANAES